MDTTLNKIFRVFDDPMVEEISCNGLSNMLVRRRGRGIVESKGAFSGSVQMTKCLQDFANEQGLRLDPIFPFAGGILSGQIRWHAVLSPVAVGAPILYLRRQRFQAIRLHAYGDEILSLESLLKSSPLVLFCGSSGAGKTTFMHAWLEQIACRERTIILENTLEFPVSSSYWVRLLAHHNSIGRADAFTLDDGLLQALRLGAERFVLGEIRGPEVGLLLNMALSGHPTWSTLHGLSLGPAAILARLSLLAGRELVELYFRTASLVIFSLRTLGDGIGIDGWVVEGEAEITQICSTKVEKTIF